MSKLSYTQAGLVQCTVAPSAYTKGPKTIETKARSYLWSRCRIPFGESSLLEITDPLRLGLDPSHKLPGASVEHACGLKFGAGQAEVMQGHANLRKDDTRKSRSVASVNTSNGVLYLLTCLLSPYSPCIVVVNTVNTVGCRPLHYDSFSFYVMCSGV